MDHTFLPFLVLLLVLLVSGAPQDERDVQKPPLFYINLDRRPDRRHFMEDEFARRGLNSAFDVVRYPARDGAATTFSPEELAYFKDCDFKHSYNFNLLVANQLSHMGVWRALIGPDQDYAVVLQDDAELSEDFGEVVFHIMNHARPADAAVIWLGLHRFADRSFSLPFPLFSSYDPNIFSDPINGNEAVGIANWNPCSLAYIVTQSGAKELLEHFRTHGIKRATDNAIIDALKPPSTESVQARNRNYIARRVVATGHVSFMHDSDIFARHDQPSLAPEYGRAYAESLAEQSNRQQEGKQEL